MPKDKQVPKSAWDRMRKGAATIREHMEKRRKAAEPKPRVDTSRVSATPFRPQPSPEQQAAIDNAAGGGAKTTPRDGWTPIVDAKTKKVVGRYKKKTRAAR
jgi:hypothetical protein